jgi:hypothetical protein
LRNSILKCNKFTELTYNFAVNLNCILFLILKSLELIFEFGSEEKNKNQNQNQKFYHLHKRNSRRVFNYLFINKKKKHCYSMVILIIYEFHWSFTDETNNFFYLTIFYEQKRISYFLFFRCHVFFFIFYLLEKKNNYILCLQDE